MNREIPDRYAAFRIFFPTGRIEIGGLTLVLLLGSLVVSIFTHFGANQDAVDWVSITRYRSISGHFGWKSGLFEICHGQIWRLFTPFFLHFGIVHLLVNSIWIFIFGTLIEKRQGFLVLLLLVLAIAILSNLAQYVLRGPAFGGMSGVMSGLLGYIWMRGTFDPASGLRLDRSVLVLAVFCALASILGLFQRIAQVAHAAGFLAGFLWGLASGLRARNQRSRSVGNSV